MGGTCGARRADETQNAAGARQKTLGQVTFRVAGQLGMAAVAERGTAEKRGKREARLDIEGEVRKGRREDEEEGSNAG